MIPIIHLPDPFVFLDDTDGKKLETEGGCLKLALLGCLRPLATAWWRFSVSSNCPH